jgi:glycosyltransferase involved in cell wall biosynthesis
MAVQDTTAKPPQVSVIIPARNEEANLGSCLDSLMDQGKLSFEVIVVNDHSTDRTKEIAESFPGVRVIDAGTLPPGWTGKNNAVATGARAARANWFLFTDADTVHLPGSLARALSEAKENAADLLSYSPQQLAGTFWEKAALPVVFAELARQFPPSQVSDPKSSAAAANGQYILVTREAYEAVGGHAALASSILEDVALARAVKASGRKIRFRYAADAVRTRMYRNFQQLREGWTKNLALLFPHLARLAAKMLLLWSIPLAAVSWMLFVSITANGASPSAPLLRAGIQSYAACGGIAILGLLWNTFRLRRADFGLLAELLGTLFGMPMFAYLLLRSKRAHERGNVSWKGRAYGSGDPSATKPVEGKLSAAGKLL